MKRLILITAMFWSGATSAYAATTPLRAMPVTIPSPAGEGSGEPFLAVGPEGEVWLSWFERRGVDEKSGHAFKLARLENRRWSKPQVIAQGDSFFVNWADFPTVLPLGGDRLVAHWPWRSGGETYAYDVMVSRSHDGGSSWTPGMRPHDDRTQTEHGFVRMVPEGDGARIVWLDGRNFAKAEAEGEDHDGHGMKAEMTLRTAWLGNDGRLTHEAVIDPRVCDCCQTAAVATSRGVLVAYRDRSDTEIRDIWLARLQNGVWSEPYPLHHDGWEIPGCPVNGPSLHAIGDRVVAAWYTGVAGGKVLLAFSDDAGASFGDPIRLDDGAAVGRVDVVLLEDGSALAVWLEDQGRSAAIRARWVDRERRPHRAWTVARTRSARSSGFPRVVRTGEQLVFAWTEVGSPARVRTSVARLQAVSYR